ncbi:MAG: S41 family peptidase [Clostridium sp.]
MNKLSNLKKILDGNYFYKHRIVEEQENELIRNYIRMINDPYLKYIDNKDGFISIFDALGIRVNETSSTMIEIIGFYDYRERILKSGDIIISVNNDNPYKSNFIEHSLNSKKNKIKIVAIRNLNSNDVELICEDYDIPVINTEPSDITFYEDNINSIFYMRLPDCNRDIERYINKSLHYKNLILDLRDNFGGNVKNTYKMLSLLCENGQIAYMKKDNNNNIKIMKVTENGHIKHNNIIVIINRNTMSSAELLAISLRDNRKAVIIGEKSFGKAIMTKKYILDENSYIMIPKYVFLSPKGENINNN